MGMSATPKLLQMTSESQSRGLDVTAECYPYTARARGIQSTVFDG